MNNFMRFILAVAGVVVLSIVSSLGVHYYVCDKEVPIATEGTSFSTLAENAVSQVMNPEFTTDIDVCQYRSEQTIRHVIDSIFMSIPHPALVKISQVVLGRQRTATVEDIVQEYNRNYKTIYQYIKEEPTLPQTIPITPDTIKLPKEVVRDTLINNQGITLIKETVKNE